MPTDLNGTCRVCSLKASAREIVSSQRSTDSAEHAGFRGRGTTSPAKSVGEGRHSNQSNPSMRSIFLDFNSTTPVAASVRESMLPFLGEFYGHPSSSHWFGRAAQEKAIEEFRSNVATLLGCHPSEVIYTSGGTESVNLALLGQLKHFLNRVPTINCILLLLCWSIPVCVARPSFWNARAGIFLLSDVIAMVRFGPRF